MEYIIFFGCVAVFVAVVCIGGKISERKKKAEFIAMLRTDYGKLREREYDPDRFQRIGSYFLKHREENQLDDITWNDLGMDEIFKKMNYTWSATGEEYLYYTLRSTGRNLEELEQFEELVTFFQKSEEARVSLQVLTAKLGYMGKYSLYDYLDNLDYLGKRSSLKSLIGDGLLILMLILLPFYTGYALMGLLAVIFYNSFSYFAQKKEIQPYIVSFMYILKLMDITEQIEKLPDTGKNQAVNQVLNQLKAGRKELQAMKAGAGILLSGGGVTGGNPLEIVFDYIRMIFHVDLIQFNRMLKVIRENSSAADSLAAGIGKLETAVAVGAWRMSLKEGSGFCIPKLCEKEENRGMEFFLEEGYHPLLTRPVKNSIKASRGVLLTGSNASGKSTFLKTCALNAILAQTVHTCTADQYSAPLFRIFSSMALKDDIEGGDSYYIVEIKALKRILEASKQEGRPVLCFVDEVLRGTNTVERIAASTQIIRSLHKNSILCFAATHDIELTELLENSCDNYHFEEEVIEGDICFQYRLLDGKAVSRNAIKLLEIIGYDSSITEKAEKMAKQFLSTGTWS